MLTPTNRTALASLASHLAPGADRTVLTSFVMSNLEACLAEMADASGSDQHRTVLYRVLADHPDAHEHFAAFDEALASYPSQVAEEGRSLLLRRHPAWVGLARLERAGGPESADDGETAEAIALTNAGFAAAASANELGRGEALWAMAEQAETVGWTDRYETLMDAAVNADFAEPAHQAEVRLLVGMHRTANGRADGQQLLQLVVTDDVAEVRSRVHAAWVLAHEDAAEATHWLSQALEVLDEEDDADIRARLQAALVAAQRDDG
jgi:hypothetical protein